MLKKSITLLFIINLLFSTFFSGFSVVCHGSDGHIAIEPINHKHCVEQTNNTTDFNTTTVTTTDQNHCQDSKTTSNLIISYQKEFKFSLCKVCTTKSFSKNFLTSHTNHISLKNDKLPAFYEPLRTIVLLA